MAVFKAPTRDIKFVINDVLDFPAHYAKLPCGEDATPDMIDAILTECAKFCEEVLSPLNQVGDQQGCQFDNGKVTTPDGFKEAYQQWIDGGWQGLSHPVEYGGQGLPLSLGLLKSELVGTANWAWGMYPGLSLGAMNTLYVHGTDEQKDRYLPKLTTGEWTGTMCLTESHCGSDLGQMRTRAEPNDDGSFAITGTKIFISAGEHDLTDNIVHIVLARTPDAPEGTKGISLFIVPKFHVDENGEMGEFNNVSCGSIEHKMGIHGNATAVINFDGAKGYMLGPKNEGLACMFTFMNTARVGTAVQGLAAAELAYQNSYPYAMDRYSMRSLSGHKNPDKPADAIIHHPDVRRMILTQKAFAEGGRAMLYDAARQGDIMMFAETEEERENADNQLGFVTPILKAFLTETGLECANYGMQVYGGHGYIAEHGMEQIVRDARIATLYEGTTGIQAMDLLGRKVILDGLKLYRSFSKRMYGYGLSILFKPGLSKYGRKLLSHTFRWNRLCVGLLLRASRNRDAVGAGSYDFLMISGYVTMAYFWARMAETAQKKLSENPSDRAFYEAKLETAEFFFERLLPRAIGHAEAMRGSVGSMMDMSLENFEIR
ncbi:acyl-CoA dehydrogenase C-terminal domain-containing protein [Litorivivens sp.]|uniref:acyl-CoA dehydrogenase C-terminal domain-containing protein n=5 Tax=Litorivivens sp. TaxID=2020868 RepID=UPI003566B3EC